MTYKHLKLGICVHCKVRKIIHARGLCRTCYMDKVIRIKYETTNQCLTRVLGGTLCRHCKLKTWNIKGRGLCGSCYKNSYIRAMYPTQYVFPKETLKAIRYLVRYGYTDREGSIKIGMPYHVYKRIRQKVLKIPRKSGSPKRDFRKRTKVSSPSSTSKEVPKGTGKGEGGT